MSRLKELRTPVFWVEGHPGALDREGWEIEVTGLCDKPGRITWNQLLSMPKTIADARLTSVTRFSVRGKWGGVKVSDILDEVKATSQGKVYPLLVYQEDLRHINTSRCCPSRKNPHGIRI